MTDVACDEILAIVSSGERGADGRPDVLAHLRTCARCRMEAPALVRMVATIRDATGAALGGHLPSHRIVDLAMDDAASSPEPVEQAHLAACVACAAEVQEVRRAESERLRARNETASGLHPSQRVWLGGLFGAPAAPGFALAAALAVLVLGYPAFRGLHDVPKLRSQVRALEERATNPVEEKPGAAFDAAHETLTPQAGPVRLVLLSSAVRGESGATAVQVEPAEPYIFLGVRPILTGPATDTDVYRFVIAGPDGREVWSADVTAGAIRARMRTAPALIFPVASALLGTGRHEMRVAPADRPADPVLRVVFEVVPADPDPASGRR